MKMSCFLLAALCYLFVLTSARVADVPNVFRFFKSESAEYDGSVAIRGTPPYENNCPSSCKGTLDHVWVDHPNCNTDGCEIRQGETFLCQMWFTLGQDHSNFAMKYTVLYGSFPVEFLSFEEDYGPYQAGQYVFNEEMTAPKDFPPGKYKVAVKNIPEEGLEQECYFTMTITLLPATN